MSQPLPTRKAPLGPKVAQPVGQALPVEILAALVRLDRLHRTAPTAR
ncbi:hypothetical protein [Sphingomonas sp. PR090111-T3T-6A]|nr:hypothetical protein [Sphingomonas sp. PR090111-T3T-6A]